jgi:hypothetical protein
VENVVGGAYERREKCTRFWWESPCKRVKSEVRGKDEKKGSEWILERLARGFRMDSVGSV